VNDRLYAEKYSVAEMGARAAIIKAPMFQSRVALFRGDQNDLATL
jgi:hypothetical protein